MPIGHTIPGVMALVLATIGNDDGKSGYLQIV